MQKTGRDLPPFPNLRKFLDFLDREDDLKTLSTPVDVHLEATALHQKVIGSAGPAVLVSNPVRADRGGFAAPLLINLFGTSKRVAN